MNIGMTLAAIFSLVLALAAAGGATKDQTDTHSTRVPGTNLNHNETLVRDAAQLQPVDAWALWLSDAQTFGATLFMQLSIYRAGGVPSVDGVNLNHNETLVRDAAPAE